MNKYFVDASGERRLRLMSKKCLVIEIVIGVLVRWLDRSIWVFPIVILSLLAVQCHVPCKFFDLLTSLRILYCRSTSRAIARDRFFENNTTNPFGHGSKFEDAKTKRDNDLRDHILNHLNKTEFELLERPDW